MWSSVRDLLRSDVFELLKEKYFIVIITPSIANKYFLKEFESSNTKLIEIRQPSDYLRFKLETILNTLNNLFLSAFINTFKVRYSYLKNNIIFKFLLFLIHKLPEKFNRSISLFITYLRGYFIQKNLYDDLFLKYNPELIICNFTLGTSKRSLDRYVSAASKKFKTPLVVQLNGWDNLTTKGTFSIKPDFLFVWNNIMKEEAIKFHDFDSKKIIVTGCPGHDIFWHKSKYIKNNKSDFFIKKKLNPNKKLITYATGGFGIYPNESDLIKTIYNSFSKYLNHDWQLLIRPHPVYKEEDFKGLDNLLENDNVVIDFPGKFDKNGIGSDLDKNHLSHFVETLFYSDVILNFFSTINIDACILDKPVINISFTERAYEKKFDPLRLKNYNHNYDLLKDEYIPNANSIDDLLKFTSAFISDSNFFNDKRKIITQNYCWKFDGKSGERVANEIIKLIESS